MVGLIDKDPGFVQGVHMYQGNLAHSGVAADLGREVTAQIADGENQ